MKTVASSGMSVRATNAIERLIAAHPELGVTPKLSDHLTPKALRVLLNAAALRQNRTVMQMLTLSVKNCGRRTAREIMAFAGEEDHVCMCGTCGRTMSVGSRLL